MTTAPDEPEPADIGSTDQVESESNPADAHTGPPEASADGETPAFIDWDLAAATARRLARPGPHATLDEVARVVADLRSYAVQATPLVRECTGLTAEVAVAPVLVVDRPSWVQANVDAFAEVLAPLFDKLAAKRLKPAQLATKVGSRVTGVELGAVLAFLSGKVLGQFDPYHHADGEKGRLLLVAPNIVAVGRELRVDPRDFRLWVCLHEETHRVQFTSIGWLEGYLRGLLAELLGSQDLDPSAVLSRLRDGLERAVRAVRGGPEGGTDRPDGVLDLLSTPEQRATLDRITATMTLLEGHADVVMDLAAPQVIGSLSQIRAKFDARRTAGSSPLDLVLRKLLGLDAKMRQYREGAAFVRAVIDRVGMDGFNQVWIGPDTLPTPTEIAHPDAWLSRVAGVAA